MKRVLTILLSLLIIFLTFYYHDTVTNSLLKVIANVPKVSLGNKNEYYKNYNYEYVQNIDEFVPYSFQDILNIFYTAINSGYQKFTFYCPVEYSECIDDIKNVSNTASSEILTTISNYVSPFNSFSSINVTSGNKYEITVSITPLYTEEEIKLVNDKIDEIWTQLVKPDMSTEDIIYAFHDYIINNTKYDEEFEKGTSTHKSNIAIGPLYEGYAICSGYTDVMAIVLDRLKLNNYKIASSSHIWNLVYVKDKWLHIDLTWDDPVSSNHNINNLLHKFYLIDTKALLNFDTENHNFNTSLYIEAR